MENGNCGDKNIGNGNSGMFKSIDISKMTDEEKSKNKSYETTGGYLKKYTYKEAWENFWNKTDDKNKQKFLNLPNFDEKIFYEITGIDVSQNALKGKRVDVIFDGINYSAIIE